MNENVITFPIKKTKIKNDTEIQDNAIEFANEILEYIHDEFHEQTEECIYTDEKYESIVALIGMSLTALYFKSKGIDHILHDIVDDVFSVDNDDFMVYDELNENEEES